MRYGAFIMIILILALVFLIDWYVFQGIKTLTSNFQNPAPQSIIHLSFWIVSLGLPLLLAYCFLAFGRTNPLTGVSSSLFITFMATKLVFVLILMGGDLFRVAEGAVNWAANTGGDENFIPGRRKFVSQLALGVAVIPFASFLYGITKGKYNFKVHRHTLYFNDLPKAFDGFTITQISDIHAGSFDDKEAVRRGVEMINEQHSDLFVFTGDMVNSRAAEFDPWVDIFAQIKAPYGQYSVLGNHDYGSYAAWPSKEAERANFELLKQQHANAGFRLLLDEHIEIERNDHKIALLGVENWGIGFGKRGDLNKALQGVENDTFKILLSHDPSHWDAEVKNHSVPVHLTLSGHTHGMQMGVEIPGIKWSPVKYRYPRWAGVYEEAGKYINVNRGFGFLGFAGRVGIWPEITVLELRRSREA